MFDVSFAELVVIAVVALLVIGPEKLPKVARTVGALTGRVQRYVGQVKEEVNRELRFEELQKLQQEIKQSVNATQSNVAQQVAEIENSILSQDDSLSTPEPVAAPKKPTKPRVAKIKPAATESESGATDKVITKKAATKTKKVEM
ncbi:MAG: twin arginine-targeting protein translocase TatB [Proteobacteria bacterium ST_bin12]|nr:MAG: twin arginine-targeting protein translocase TatB [Proteobacteria bacterium ST_bin12]